MTNSLARDWIELECVFGSAVPHVSRHDLRRDVDWDRIQRHLLTGAICTACSMLEASGSKGRDDHVRLLFELRNALVHNGGDISRNSNQKAMTLALSYLAGNRHLELSTELIEPYFALRGSIVYLTPSVLFAIRMYMQSDA